MQLGIAGDHQRSNAAIAIKACELFGEQVGEKSALTYGAEMKQSLQKTFWPGGSQIINIGAEPSDLQLYVDGAHTLKSIQACCNWFLQSIQNKAPQKTILLFNTSHNRDSHSFLDEISTYKRTNGEALFDHCIFTNFDTTLSAPPEYQSIDIQEALKEKWLSIFPESSAMVCP